MNNDYMEDIVKKIADSVLIDRSPMSLGHQISQDHIIEKLKELGLKPGYKGHYLQPILNKDNEVVGENIIAVTSDQSENYILLIAHYDTVPDSPGADDNAAAIAIILNTIKELKEWKGNTGIMVLISDLEEPPNFHTDIMGSTYFYNNCPIEVNKIACPIVLDLVGHDVPMEKLEDALFVTGAEYSRPLTWFVERSGERTEGITVYPVRNSIVGNLSDHHVFQQNNRPFLFLTCGESPYYHAPLDIKTHLNFNKMSAISQFLKYTIEHIDRYFPQIESQKDPEFVKKGFLPVEARSYSKALGQDIPAIEIVLNKVGKKLRYGITSGE